MTFEIINQEDLLELPSSLAPSGTSYHPLSTEQLTDLRSAMQAPIHIVSKDGRASISTPVHAVVSSACASLKYLLSLQQQRSSSPRHIQWQSQSQQQISIRGSGRFTYDSDMDFFIKSSQAPNTSSPYEFRNFCLTVMIAAFDSLMGRPMQESIDSSSSTISPRASSYSLHDKVSGIFKSFFPFPDQSGCIFSLNTDPSRHGADVDITFHFRPSSTQQMSPSLSPQLATASASGSLGL